MAVFKYIIPALAVAGGVSAQFGGSSTNSICTNSATTTIKSQAEATALAGCPTFEGSIAIDADTVDNIDLSGISQITGDLSLDNVTQITQLSGSQLSVIGGALHLNGLTRLSTVNFPSLVNVNTIYMNAIPNLPMLNFAQGVQQLSSLDIENTGLTTLQGISLTTADTIFIANNNFLQTIDLPLGNITKSLMISSNGQQLSVQLPNLLWANAMTIRGAAEVSTPALRSINGSLAYYTGSFETYSAPNLTTVGAALSFVSNSQLSNISLPALTTIGAALFIVSDPKLDKVDGFPALKNIGGNVLAYGSFSEFDLPALGYVKGTFNLTSSEDISSSCKVFDPIHGKDKTIRGVYNCKGKVASAAGNNVSVSDLTNNSTSADGTTKPSSASGLLIPSTVVLSVVAVMFGLL